MLAYCIHKLKLATFVDLQRLMMDHRILPRDRPSTLVHALAGHEVPDILGRNIEGLRSVDNESVLCSSILRQVCSECVVCVLPLLLFYPIGCLSCFRGSGLSGARGNCGLFWMSYRPGAGGWRVMRVSFDIHCNVSLPVLINLGCR